MKQIKTTDRKVKRIRDKSERANEPKLISPAFVAEKLGVVSVILKRIISLMKQK